MKIWDIIIKFIILIAGLVVLAFNILLYHSFEQQKYEMNLMSDQQKQESQVNSNKFNYQQGQIEQMSKDLQDSQDQIKSLTDALVQQKDSLALQQSALLQEITKRQQVENENKSIQTSLMDIKAEADAIKQDMKGWQKDYVGVLAELEKKMDDSQDEMKAFEKNITDLNIPDLKENIDSLKAEIESVTPAAADKAQSTQSSQSTQSAQNAT